mmetsp:Transcript_101400/g.158375  ORF Transcript_101400/g.158375 Transcript_101400/m.158375 type:complete len:486 (+) Transcript_101400:33-1490(+)
MGCAASTSVPICQSGAASRGMTNYQVPTATRGFHDQYVLGVKLGRGAFAQVREVFPVNATEAPCRGMAVKIIGLCDSETGELSRKAQEDVNNEVDLWKTTVGSSHIIQLYDVFLSSSLAYMVMERCSTGLFHYLENSPCFNEQLLRKILHDMVTGIRQLHMHLVVHRDIKPDNFMIAMDPNQTVKLCDFGLSGRRSGTKKLHGNYGTAPFMCPEMLLRSEYDEKADIWSLGVIAYVLIFGCFPYQPKEPSSKNMKNAIIDGASPRYVPVGRRIHGLDASFRSGDAVEFVKILLNRQPRQRPSAVDVLSMSYVNLSTPIDYPEGAELPSLRPMLYSARRVGAFEVRNNGKVVDIDTELAQMQMEKHGKPLPESTKRSQDTADASSINVGAFLCVDREDTSNTSTALGTASSSGSLAPSSLSAVRSTCSNLDDHKRQPSAASTTWGPSGSGWSKTPSNVFSIENSFSTNPSTSNTFHLSGNALHADV